MAFKRPGVRSPSAPPKSMTCKSQKRSSKKRDQNDQNVQSPQQKGGTQREGGIPEKAQERGTVGTETGQKEQTLQIAPVDIIPENSKVEGGRKEKASSPAVAPVKPEGIELVNSGAIHVDPAKLQFKKGVNPKTGEQEPLTGKWDKHAGGVVTLFRDTTNKLWAVNGHHRVALASRLGGKNIPAYILESKDGWTFERARKKGAELNIMEGQGDIYDHAEFFRQETGITEAQAGGRNLQKSAFAHGKIRRFCQNINMIFI